MYDKGCYHTPICLGTTMKVFLSSLIAGMEPERAAGRTAIMALQRQTWRPASPAILGGRGELPLT